MTALAGIWMVSGEADLRSTALRMVAAQRDIAPHGDAARVCGNIAFGRGLYRLLPEDVFDTSVWSTPGGGLFVGDARIDNRGELLDVIGLPRSEYLSDSELLCRAFVKLDEGVLDRVIGDYAFAVWNPRKQLLTLARDPTGQRPLHYYRGQDRILFASTAPGIHAAGIERRLNRGTLSEFVADVTRSGDASYFEEILRVEPGQIVTASVEDLRTRKYWHAPAQILRFPKDEDYVDAYRAELDRAVRVRLRGGGGTVGAHLSCGLDSGAVASTTARLQAEAGGKVIAFTSAPRLGFDGPLPRGRIGDESFLAAEVAALYPNMEHVVIRPDGGSQLDLLRRDGSLYQEPMGLPCNQLWLSAVADEARDRGITVMMSGGAGNLTISAGGITALSEYVRTGKWGRLFKETRAARGQGLRYRGIAMGAFAPWLPSPVWRTIKRIFSGPSITSQGMMMLHPDRRPRLLADSAARSRTMRPPTDHRHLRWHLLQSEDPGNFRKAMLGRWGIDERDPTNDRRLAEFCLALPPEQLIRNGVTRRLARLALADRLPSSILHGPRGYQGADWYEVLSPEAIRRSLEALGRDEDDDFLDRAHINRLLQGWPTGDWASGAVISTYRIALLRALSAAHFAYMATGHRTDTQ